MAPEEVKGSIPGQTAFIAPATLRPEEFIGVPGSGLEVVDQRPQHPEAVFRREAQRWQRRARAVSLSPGLLETEGMEPDQIADSTKLPPTELGLRPPN